MTTKFLNWLDSRTGVISFLKVVGNRRWVKALMDLKMWPAILFFLCVVQCITGFILWMHYSPSSQTAYESVFNIQYNLWGGWFLRGIHHFSAQVFVGVAILYVIRIILFGMYRKPREVTFWLSMFLFFFGLGACLTGDLLPWTQNAYGATMVRVKYLTQIPFIGQFLYELACGGTTINNLTLTHFFALHVGVFAAGIIGLLILHAICDARAEKIDLDAKLASGEVTVPCQKAGSCGGCRSTGIARWWVCQAAVNSLGCLIAMCVVLGLVFQNNSEYKAAKAAWALQNAAVETPAAEEAAPAPATEEAAPAPATEEAAPAPAVEEAAPAPAVEEVAPAPVTEPAQDLVVEEVPAPAAEEAAPAAETAPTAEPAPAPAAEPAPEPVIEEVPAPAAEEVAPAPAAGQEVAVTEDAPKAEEAKAEEKEEVPAVLPVVMKPGLYLGVELGPPADTSPMASSETARPEWTFRGLYEYALLFSSKCPEFILIFCIPTIIVGIFFLMPFIARLKSGYIINTAYFVIVAIVMIYLTMASYQRDAKNDAYQTARKAETAKAISVFNAIQDFGGIRKTGALSMISETTATADSAEKAAAPSGPEVFKKHCASCHPFAPADESVTGDEIFRMDSPCAPNLWGYGTRDWIAGWFDKDRIVSKDYYGYENSPFKDENMALFAASLANEIAEFENPQADEDSEDSEDSEDDEEDAAPQVNPRDEIAKVIDLLTEEASLAAPRENGVTVKKLRRPWKDDKGAPVKEITEYQIDGLDPAVFAIYSARCLKCHGFYAYPVGQKGHQSPDLTAYGSKEWTKRVIRDAGVFFKGNTMTVFHAEPEGSENNVMTEAEIEAVSAWLTEGNLKK